WKAMSTDGSNLTSFESELPSDLPAASRSSTLTLPLSPFSAGPVSRTERLSVLSLKAASTCGANFGPPACDAACQRNGEATRAARSSTTAPSRQRSVVVCDMRNLRGICNVGLHQCDDILRDLDCVGKEEF